MKVRMLVSISGGRGDGSSWPPPGGELEVGDEEGAHLCAAKLAMPVAEEPKTEKAVAPPEEKRAAARPRAAKQG